MFLPPVSRFSVEPLTSASSELNLFPSLGPPPSHSGAAAVHLFARHVHAPRGAGDQGNPPARRADTPRGWMPSNPPAEPLSRVPEFHGTHGGLPNTKVSKTLGVFKSPLIPSQCFKDFEQSSDCVELQAELTAFVCVAELKLQKHEHLSSGILQILHTLLPSTFLSVLIYRSSCVIV